MVRLIRGQGWLKVREGRAGNRREKNMDKRKFNALAFERTGADDLYVECAAEHSRDRGTHATPNREGK